MQNHKYTEKKHWWKWVLSTVAIAFVLLAVVGDVTIIRF